MQAPNNQVPPTVSSQVTNSQQPSPEEIQAGLQANQAGGSDIIANLDEHLSSLPQEHQQYLAEYMTPETALAFGIVLGKEALDYFMSMADSSRMLVSVPREEAAMASQGSMTQPETMSQPQPTAQGIMTPQTAT